MSTPAPEGGTAAAPRAADLSPGAAERLLGELRQEAVRADTKGSILVAAQGMAAAALVGVLAARGWHPTDLSGFGQVLWWAGAACFLVSLTALLMAVVPRYRTVGWQPGDPLTHFADIRGRRATDRRSWRRPAGTPTVRRGPPSSPRRRRRRRQARPAAGGAAVTAAAGAAAAMRTPHPGQQYPGQYLPPQSYPGRPHPTPPGAEADRAAKGRGIAARAAHTNTEARLRNVRLVMSQQVRRSAP
ncbi:Pycsar system effector family protein [Streptomyces narbonensis]